MSSDKFRISSSHYLIRITPSGHEISQYCPYSALQSASRCGLWCPHLLASTNSIELTCGSTTYPTTRPIVFSEEGEPNDNHQK